MNLHLSSEQLESMLHGEPSPEAAQHLSGCVQCSGELVSLRQAFGNFREAATATAEHYSRSTSPVVARKVPRMAWGFAAAALFVSIATPLVVEHRNASVVAVKVPQPTPSMSDEALLNSVQNDLSSSVPESLLPLAGTPTNTTNSTNAQRKN
jgi:hypothetical protein